MNKSLKLFSKFCKDDDCILPGHGSNGLWTEIKTHNPYFKNI
jgi:hypothetical protein